MKRIYTAILLSTISIAGLSQKLAISISNPQPRLGDVFELSVDVNALKAEIFKSIQSTDKAEIDSEYAPLESGVMKMKITALKKGMNQLGPLFFTLNGQRFESNTVSYEVVDALPNTDNGLWFRKLKTSDTSFCIIIDQRIPAAEKMTRKGDNSISITNEPETNDYVKLKEMYDVPGLSSGGSETSTDYSTIKVNGEDQRYLRCFSIYRFIITDKAQKIRLTKDLFENLPKGYSFQTITFQ